MAVSSDDDFFFITVTDGTKFCIYDLQMSEDSATMSFGYEAVDETSVSKEHYEEEVGAIVQKVVTDALQFVMEQEQP